jgi:hypothetical protein
VPPPPWRRAATTLLAVALVVLGALRVAPAPVPAAAAVGHVAGYRATVDGFTSWYGSYDLGAIGTAWCIDHGIRAPDPDLAYLPTGLLGTSDDVRAALAWAVGRHGAAPDRVTSAALMLVAHDLMGATYPSGRLDLSGLTRDRLAGFGGDEAAVLDRARAIAAEARAHAHLRPPWGLELSADDPAPGAAGSLVARLTAGGAPAAGIELAVVGVSTGPVVVTTGPDGTAAVPFTGHEGAFQLRVEATLPDLTLEAFAPTAARAQRVVRPAVATVAAAVDRTGVVPTGELLVRKTGVPSLPVAGAHFEVRPADPGHLPHESTTLRDVVIGADGTAGPFALPSGAYELIEITAPPGYLPGGPWPVSITAGSLVEVEARNTPIPTTTTPTTSTTSTTSPTISTTAPTTALRPAAVPTTATTPAPPTIPLPTPSTPRSLPRTGADPLALGCIGTGLALVGGSIRPRRRPPAA